MKKLADKSMVSNVSVAQQSIAAPMLSPQRPRTTPMSLPQQPKSLSQPGQQPIRDIPLPDPVKTAELIHDNIAKRAYEIYIERGCPQGQSVPIWRQAELELRYKNIAALRAKSHQ